jgi:hypothetical protein
MNLHDSRPVPLMNDRRSPPGGWAALFRLYLSSSIMVTCLIAYFSPISLQRAAFRVDGGSIGWYVLGALAVLSVLAALDSLLNDIFPARWHFRATEHRRHLLFMSMALLLAVVVAVNFKQGLIFGLMIRYALDLSACVAVAALHVLGLARRIQRESLC